MTDQLPVERILPAIVFLLAALAVAVLVFPKIKDQRFLYNIGWEVTLFVTCLPVIIALTISLFSELGSNIFWGFLVGCIVGGIICWYVTDQKWKQYKKKLDEWAEEKRYDLAQYEELKKTFRVQYAGESSFATFDSGRKWYEVTYKSKAMIVGNEIEKSEMDKKISAYGTEIIRQKVRLGLINMG